MKKPFFGKSKRQRTERIMALVAIATLLIAWFIGTRWIDGDIEGSLEELLPNADSFTALANDTYAAYQDGQLVAYAITGEAQGYGGPMQVVVAVDLEGYILNAVVAEHNETPSWYDRTLSGGMIDRLIGRSSTESLEFGKDVDGVTGATYTSRAIAQAVRDGSHAIATGKLDLPVASPPATIPIQFGLPEVAVIALFIMGYINRRKQFKYKKQLRWVSLLAGMVVLGFMSSLPLTVAMISKFLLGYWPQWQSNLYWYILIGGMLLFFITENQNVYCEWFCPFGAVQECAGFIGDAKPHSGGKYRNLLTWLQRGLAWLAILLALLFRNPGLTSYEIFGTMFTLEGSTIQFALLGIILVAALFIKRPWCRFLCPIHPIGEFIRLIRSWIKELWQNVKA